MKKNIYNLIFFICFKIYFEYKYKISIIIPVYKGEKYIRDCIETLINQTLTNIQIIFIDDESPDNSSNIIKEYAKTDQRIILKYIKHASISETRNEGLKYVEGEYLGFMDDDDFIDPEQYEKMYEYAKKDDCDFVGFGDERFNEGINELKYNNIVKLNYSNSNVNTTKYFKNYKNEIWNKIYKTKIIKENGIKFFPIGAEDLHFNLQFYPFVKRHKFINTKSYYYRLKKRVLYNRRHYLFNKSDIFFNSLNEFYHKIELDKKDPILFLHLFFSAYENLYYAEDLKLNIKYLKIFFNVLEKSEIFNKNNIEKMPKDNIEFYHYIFNAYNEKKKEDL